MNEGYVLDFSNATFQKFVAESVKLDIYDSKYSSYGDSKGKRLRCFWDVETPSRVKKLLLDLLELKIQLEDKKVYRDPDYQPNEKLIEECRKIIESIDSDDLLEHIDELKTIEIDDGNIELLLKSIRENIENNEPELALDRLHTFSVKYIRDLCDKNGITYDNNKPLQSIYGEYIKDLEKKGLIDAEMTFKIVKYSISILDSFNYVRNNQSFAHDNEVLNYQESLLIYRTVASILSFINTVEMRRKEKLEKIEGKKNSWEIQF